MRTFPLKPKTLLLLALGSVALLSLLLLLAGRLKLEHTRKFTARTSNRMANFPPVVLWAWERPEDLRFIEPRETGVAFLARTLYLRGGRVVVRPRLQPLRVPPGTFLIAVARIESDRRDVPELSREQRAKAAAEVAEMSRTEGIAAVQIDFDATLSERDFYRDLLRDVRGQLPDSTALSITALASWCMHDDWLTGLPIDEAVPMLFRMGVDRRQILMHLNAGGDFSASLCRASSGLSTDEPLAAFPAAARTYFFHPHSWTPAATRQLFGRDVDEH